MKVNVKEKLLEILKGRYILFIEGDYGLYNSVGGLEKLLIDNKIQYHTITHAGKVSLNYIQDMANWYDVIVWESTYITETARNIMNLLFDDDLVRPEGVHTRILLECYINEPLYWYKPEGLKKRLLGLTGINHDLEMDMELYEFGDDEKPIWEKADDEL